MAYENSQPFELIEPFEHFLFHAKGAKEQGRKGILKFIMFLKNKKVQ